jgi:hypothetical protein
MNESSRTGIYVVVAIVALVVAWLAKPATITRKMFDDTGQRFFEPFDPLLARSMEIVSFNEATSVRNAFKVAQVNGRWAIPSHENYPADAQDHLAQAASSVMDLTKGSVVSDSPADHELYAVADPTAANAGLGSGTRITLQDERGNSLIDLIIGKQVKGSDKLRYVRTPGKDRVYTTAIDTTALTTKFEEWIERDLLKLNAYQIKDVVIDNYSVDEINNRLIRGDKLVLHWSQTDYKWTLEGLQPGESLKSDKLDQLRTALSDLKIVDVRRKPAGMSAQLALTGNIQLNDESLASLLSAGYYLAQIEPGKRELFSNQGEMSFRTTEGVEYTLRFGEVVNVKGSTDLNKSPGESDAANETGRYLFVTAGFNQSLLDQPKYDPVPDEPAAPAAAETRGGGEGGEGENAATQPTDPVIEAARKARQAVIDANEQKRKDFEKKVADGQEKVKQLNARFADWYYVVPDSVYQKLKLKRADIVGGPSAPGATSSAEPPTEE